MARGRLDPDRNLGFLLHDVARLRSAAFDQMMRPLGARQKDPADRRANRVWLTDKVVEVRRRMQRGVDVLNGTSLAGLDAQRMEDLVEALLVIKRNLIAAEEGRKAGTEGRK